MTGGDTDADPGASGDDDRVHAALERLKKRPVLSGVLFASLVTGAVGALWSTLAAGGDVVSDLVNPYEQQYDALAELDLDVRLEYFEENFGTVKSVVDACEPEFSSCPDTGDRALQLYIHETDQMTVRALFEGNALRAYLVTTTDEEFRPPVNWLGHDLGVLGETDVGSMLAVPAVEPTDTAIFSGPQAASYVEVVSVGAAGDYRGLFLASGPEGRGGRTDPEALQELALAPDGAYPADTLAELRSATAPSTYGEFRDEGAVGSWLHDADVVQVLLFSNVF